MSEDKKLWRKRYLPNSLEHEKNHDLHLWAGVFTKTGEVEMDDFRDSEDDLDELIDGWKWQRFRLVAD